MSDCHGVTMIMVLIGTYSVCGVQVRSLGLYPAITQFSAKSIKKVSRPGRSNTLKLRASHTI